MSEVGFVEMNVLLIILYANVAFMCTVVALEHVHIKCIYIPVCMHLYFTVVADGCYCRNS